MRSKTHREISLLDVATLYGERFRDERVWHLSPYEFMSDWEVEMLSYPQSLNYANHKRHPAEFTEAGREQTKK